MSIQVTNSTITQAVALLQAGKLVAFPTETVYGLGADAAKPEAVQQIFAAKGRPADHPLIVHLANVAQLEQWARDIPAQAWQLAEQFWPGPLTLILKRASQVSDVVTGGQDTIGIRIPGHPIAQALLQAFGGGIAAPSANKFGRISPTQAVHVSQEFSDEVALIIDGGECPLGIESTIVDLSSAAPRILRPGSILPRQLNAILQTELTVSQHEATPRVSGMLESHYAPMTKLVLLSSEQLQEKITQLVAQRSKFSVLGFSDKTTALTEQVLWLKMPASPNFYAHELYNAMRTADAHQGEIILVEANPASEEWFAIADRLRKAAA